MPHFGVAAEPAHPSQKMHRLRYDLVVKIEWRRVGSQSVDQQLVSGGDMALSDEEKEEGGDDRVT